MSAPPPPEEHHPPMEDSFRVRVDKVFGSLASSSSLNTSSSSLSSLWTLTDEEIEKREWNRQRDTPDDTEPKRYPPNLDGFFAIQRKLSSQSESVDFRKELEAELQVINDRDDDGNDNVYDDKGKQCHRDSLSRQLVKPDDQDDEEWEIRSSIGLDCTLDCEEEEDECDKVAIGREKADDHLCMKDITGYWTDINFYGELPNTFKDVTRDPRANHLAAKLRLKEDAEAAGKFDTLRVSDNGPHAANAQKNTLEEGVNLKSILKRKENQRDPKSQKRVRFDHGCKHDYEEEAEGAKDMLMDNCSIEAAKISEASFLPQECSGVPDYIRNPSKYTCYTFDSSSDVDEESNQKAYEDFLNQLKRSNRSELQLVDTSVDLPKSITFTPKKKSGNASGVKNGNEFQQNQEDVGKEFMPRKGWPVGIAAGEARGSEVCAMEEDEPGKVATRNSSLRRQDRKYRTKANIGLDEPIT